MVKENAIAGVYAVGFALVNGDPVCIELRPDVLHRVEGDLHVALRGKIVDLVGPRLLHDPDEVRRDHHVPVVQEESDALFVRLLVEVIDAIRVELRRMPLDAVHLVAVLQNKLHEVGAVLTGNPRDQCHGHLPAGAGPVLRNLARDLFVGGHSAC